MRGTMLPLLTTLRDGSTNNSIASRNTEVFVGECHVFVMHYKSQQLCVVYQILSLLRCLIEFWYYFSTTYILVLLVLFLSKYVLIILVSLSAFLRNAAALRSGAPTPLPDPTRPYPTLQQLILLLQLLLIIIIMIIVIILLEGTV